MALHAIDDVGDAIDATRAFLFPFDLRRWLKLALVAFFVGGGLNTPSGQFGGSGGPSGSPGPGGGGELPASLPSLPVEAMTLIAVAVAVVVLLALVFGIVGSVMEFVFIESLRNDAVRVRQYWSDRWRQGLRLFGFRVVIGLPLLALVVGWMALFVLPMVTNVQQPAFSAGVFLFGLPVLLLAGLVFAVINAFTTFFVVPLMIQRDSGVLAGWRRLWPSMKREWKQYGAFAVFLLVLSLVVGFITSIAVGLVAVVVLIPFAIIGAIVYVALSLSTTGTVLLGLLAAGFALTMLVVWALVQVPVVAYFRYYALLVLGDIDSSFDIIPDQRAAVRE
ncbi:DUF7544 domain-containing protein [Natronomonas sp.]|uniref:DUF7544 domain-containing protein n=1 Tax=Natronomonas sp. TaxID=2184060 RepID=UPI002FC2B667